MARWSGTQLLKVAKQKNLSTKGMEGYKKPKPRGLNHIETVLKRHKIEFVEEYRFSQRRFKFDLFCPELNLAIEYEGLGVGKDKKQMGGHQSMKGFTSNCEKYNLACIMGHRLLRYTALNYKDFENDLIQII